MIKRYTPREIGLVWTDEEKYRTWLKVELAIIEARVNLGLLPRELFEAICANARFTVEEIETLDAIIEHDLQAFVDVVRSSLPMGHRRYVHEDITSYDVEVPALALQFKQVGALLLRDLTALIDAVRHKASQHAWTYCMGSTHGQDAKPTTLGWRFCSHLEMLENGRDALEDCLKNIDQVKCSGAVGNWMTISPELEAEACRILGLRTRRAATQIVGRDVFSRFLSEVATIGGSIEKMATDLRLLATSWVEEVAEPRKPKQKGSSAMPHKKNTIILERMCGMATLLRGYAVMGQELIRTWLERDIAHSCVERVAFPDATAILDYMCQKMAWVVGGLEVNRNRLATNIDRSHGAWASEEVKLFLCEQGFDPEAVYAFVQQCAFAALTEDRAFYEVLLESIFPTSGKILSQTVSPADLSRLFNIRTALKHLDHGYRMMALDLSNALPSNLP